MKLTHNTIDYNVNTIAELEALAGEENQVVVVTDENRGGTFIYRSADVATNNGGTIFNGWTRQYDGPVNVKWFGASETLVDNSTILNSILLLFKNVTFNNLRLPIANTVNISLDDTVIESGGQKSISRNSLDTSGGLVGDAMLSGYMLNITGKRVNLGSISVSGSDSSFNSSLDGCISATTQDFSFSGSVGRISKVGAIGIKYDGFFANFDGTNFFGITRGQAITIENTKLAASPTTISFNKCEFTLNDTCFYANEVVYSIDFNSCVFESCVIVGYTYSLNNVTTIDFNSCYFESLSYQQGTNTGLLTSVSSTKDDGNYVDVPLYFEGRHSITMNSPQFRYIYSSIADIDRTWIKLDDLAQLESSMTLHSPIFESDTRKTLQRETNDSIFYIYNPVGLREEFQLLSTGTFGPTEVATDLKNKGHLVVKGTRIMASEDSRQNNGLGNDGDIVILTTPATNDSVIPMEQRRTNADSYKFPVISKDPNIITTAEHVSTVPLVDNYSLYSVNDGYIHTWEVDAYTSGNFRGSYTLRIMLVNGVVYQMRQINNYEFTVSENTFSIVDNSGSYTIRVLNSGSGTHNYVVKIKDNYKFII